jgi:hypothetical protein
MDTTWPFNFDNPALARHLPAYYDILIIPKYFYEAVIKKDIPALNNLIKYNPKLSIAVASFKNLTLMNAFYFKKAAKFGAPVKIKWATEKQNGKIIINFNEQSQLYSYITTAPPKYTYFGFLVNTINNYLVQLRMVMGLINNKIPANKYFDLGVNVYNNFQMKLFISQFIPGVRVDMTSPVMKDNYKYSNLGVNSALILSMPSTNSDGSSVGMSNSYY